VISTGVIVEYTGSEAAAKDIAMHIAANKPIGMNSKDVPESVIAAERYVELEVEVEVEWKMFYVVCL
jgi:elongation factor Ts